jgi:hypothetical protein
MAHEAGKGSTPRPFSIAQEEYNSRWDAIFGRDSKKEKQEDALSTDNRLDSKYDKPKEEN